MKYTKDSIIGKIVADNYKAAEVFKNWDIDFCCNGNRSIVSACEEKNIKVEQLLQEIENVLISSQNTANIDFKSWPLDLLVDYIEKKHHRYVNEQIPIITAHLEKICAVHGKEHPELFEIAKLFQASAGELTAHMKKEEFVLFPFIRKMMSTKQMHGEMAPAQFGTVANPIHVMEHEHDTEGERFRRIASLSNNYKLPRGGCNTYKVTLESLKSFEEDLHLHIHLENNILFPGAIVLEKEMFA